MAVLVEGQKFDLSSKSQTSKSVVYVKLTDSALRSLEDYLKNKVRHFSLFKVLDLNLFLSQQHEFRVIQFLRNISSFSQYSYLAITH